MFKIHVRSRNQYSTIIGEKIGQHCTVINYRRTTLWDDDWCCKKRLGACQSQEDEKNFRSFFKFHVFFQLFFNHKRFRLQTPNGDPLITVKTLKLLNELQNATDKWLESKGKA